MRRTLLALAATLLVSPAPAAMATTPACKPVATANGWTYYAAPTSSTAAAGTAVLGDGTAAYVFTADTVWASPDGCRWSTLYTLPGTPAGADAPWSTRTHHIGQVVAGRGAVVYLVLAPTATGYPNAGPLSWALLRSANGAAFSRVSAPATTSASSWSLIAEPSRPNELYAWTAKSVEGTYDSVLYRSKDSGATWSAGYRQAATSGAAATFPQIYDPTCCTPDPSRAGWLYATFTTAGPPGPSTLPTLGPKVTFRSTDYGATFQPWADGTLLALGKPSRQPTQELFQDPTSPVTFSLSLDDGKTRKPVSWLKAFTTACVGSRPGSGIVNGQAHVQSSTGDHLFGSRALTGAAPAELPNPAAGGGLPTGAVATFVRPDTPACTLATDRVTVFLSVTAHDAAPVLVNYTTARWLAVRKL